MYKSKEARLFFKRHNNINSQKPSILYRFKFVSLISPYLLSDLRLLNITSSPSTLRKSTVLMKQSYLLFTWFFYLKESSLKPSLKESRNIYFSFLPVKRTLYTLTKAPMAHKTNSKEQIQFRFFRFSVSIKTYFNWLKSPNSVDYGLYVHILAKKNFPIFETNLLILKSYEVWLLISDKSFFNLSLPIR